MSPGALLALAGVALGAVLMLRGDALTPNVRAFLAFIRKAESNDDYGVIAGGDHFTDYSEHPFVLQPNRPRRLGTTASGAYQMVRGTWCMARDALALPDFSPAAQDAAALWILQHKVRGGVFELVDAGRFDDAIGALGGEWESLAKISAGTYALTLDDARAFITSHGGTYA